MLTKAASSFKAHLKRRSIVYRCVCVFRGASFPVSKALAKNGTLGMLAEPRPKRFAVQGPESELQG